DLLVYRAKCCNPIPGDEIVGYITRGRGVAVHTRLCPNVQNLMYQTERRIAVEWGGAGSATFPVQLSIRAKDRAGLLAEITAVISGAGSNIHNLESRPDRNNARTAAHLAMWASSVEELKKLNTSDAEVAQLVKMKQAGVSDDTCVALISNAHERKYLFTSADSAVNLSRAGYSDAVILEIAKKDQLDIISGDAVMLRLIGLSDGAVD